MAGWLSVFTLEKLTEAIGKVIWTREALRLLRVSVEEALRRDEFKRLTRDAFEQTDRPAELAYFDLGFIDMPLVQEHLARYVVLEQDVDLEELARLYGKRLPPGADASGIEAHLEDYLKQLRQTFVENDRYGKLLLARDHDEMKVALAAMGEQLDRMEKTGADGLAAIEETKQMVARLLEEPEKRKVIERKTKHLDIFLSYTHTDIEFALKLKKDLEASGHTVWMDTSEIKGGDKWIAAITEGINNCDVLISLVSEAANQSKWVRREFLYADEKNKIIIPIWMEACELPIYMLDLNALKGYGKHYAETLQTLQDVLPAIPEQEDADPADRRAQELTYLDRLWLKHKIWMDTYTPMAGVAELEQQLGAKSEMQRQTAHIQAVYAAFLEEVEAHFGAEKAPTVKEEFDDITEAVSKARQLVILGDPGAGKTTTLWKLAADYAAVAKQDPKAPLPVLIELGSLEPYTSVRQQIQEQLGNISFDGLLQQHRLLLLVDALNELPLQNRAQKVAEVRDLVRLAQQHNMITAVTCRELDYTGDLDLGIAQKVEISPLDEWRIRDFCRNHLPQDGDNLFWTLAGGDRVREVWEKWQAASVDFELFWTAEDIPHENPNVYGATSGQDDNIWKNNVKNRRSMMRLARNPYMLFMMTGVFISRNGSLPRNRAQLFEVFVNHLLNKREKLSEDFARELKQRLSRLAYTMQDKGQSRGTTRDLVAEFLSGEMYHQAISANLMDGGDEPRFTHQLLQEYFAAYGLDQKRLDGLPASTIWRAEKWGEPTLWDETAILLAGLYEKDATPIIDWLKDAHPELAARCILESGAAFDAREGLRSLWTPRLTDLKHDPQPEARAAVGRGLGLLKLDNRKGVGLRADGLPDIDWVEIPNEGKQWTYQDERRDPIHSFYMARYPVTYQQFQAFMDAEDGFRNPEWWRGPAAADDDWSAPGEQYFKFSNHPRENVSWYDAIAFCRWMSVKALEHRDLLPGGIEPGKFDINDPFTWAVRLPTEVEWEKAARGTDGREYPWGPKYISGYANIDETGRFGDKVGPHYLQQTSAVGMYPQGKSPYGVLDMSGNVWEWCLNAYDKLENTQVSGSKSRSLRGGSWPDHPGPAACCPPLRAQSVQSFQPLNGFRVCCVRPPS